MLSLLPGGGSVEEARRCPVQGLLSEVEQLSRGESVAALTRCVPCPAWVQVLLPRCGSETSPQLPDEFPRVHNTQRTTVKPQLCAALGKAKANRQNL